MDIQSNAFSQLLLTTVETFFLSHSFDFTNHGGVGKGCVCVYGKKMKNYGLVIGYRLWWRKRGGNRNSFSFTRSFPQSNWRTQPYLGFFFPFPLPFQLLNSILLKEEAALCTLKFKEWKNIQQSMASETKKKRWKDKVVECWLLFFLERWKI